MIKINFRSPGDSDSKAYNLEKGLSNWESDNTV